MVKSKLYSFWTPEVDAAVREYAVSKDEALLPVIYPNVFKTAKYVLKSRWRTYDVGLITNATSEALLALGKPDFDSTKYESLFAFCIIVCRNVYSAYFTRKDIFVEIEESEWNTFKTISSEEHILDQLLDHIQANISQYFRNIELAQLIINFARSSFTDYEYHLTPELDLPKKYTRRHLYLVRQQMRKIYSEYKKYYLKHNEYPSCAMNIKRESNLKTED